VSDAFMNRLRPRRLVVLGGFDASAWLAAVILFTLVRYGSVAAMPWHNAFKVGLVAAGLHLLIGFAVRLHQGRASLGSFEEMILLGSVTALVGTVISIANIADGLVLPRSVPVAATFTSLVLMAWGRAVYRRTKEATEAGLHEGQVPVLILGAGSGGRLLINSMLGQRDLALVPVGLIDDDPLKRHLRIRGIPVVGTSEQLAEAADETGATTVIIAIPSADAECIRNLSRRVRAAGLDVKVVPSANELLNQHFDISDVRDIDVTDILGRHQIDTDLGSIADYLSGKRVLVTGAGGRSAPSSAVRSPSSAPPS
jgi:FlaA1/EpsC-like NDP-sugar epimerase